MIVAMLLDFHVIRMANFLTIAILAGALSGIGLSVLQEFTTTPLIIIAEKYEDIALKPLVESGYNIQINSIVSEFFHDHNSSEWFPGNGIERLLYTCLSNVILGIGYGFILVGCIILRNQSINSRIGVIWGIAGFVIITFAPSLGLPPELPGLAVADLASRQLWWFCTVICTAVSLWLIVFQRSWILNCCGFLILASPHIIGAPHSIELSGKIPPEIVGYFVSASLVSAAVFWILLGWLSGAMYRHMAYKE